MNPHSSQNILKNYQFFPAVQIPPQRNFLRCRPGILALNVAGTVFAAVVIRTFQQQRIWENVAQAQVDAHRRGGIGQQFFMGGYNFKFLHYSLRKGIKTKKPAELYSPGSK
jgi:hypothetical protein